MRVALIDANVVDQQFVGLAASWLRWECARHGVELVEPHDADVILVTASSQQGIPSVRGALRRAKVQGKPIVVGGGGCYGPAVFDEVATVCCVGEGERFIDVLLAKGLDAAMALPEAWIPGETRQVIPSQQFPWSVPPIMHPDGKVRLFESRGCKHKCLFCQTGWERHYIPHPDVRRLKQQCNAFSQNKVPIDLVTNDAGHTLVVNAIKGLDAISIRCDALSKVDIIRLPRMVRLGVEGVSARLRRAVGKPITTDALVENTEKLCSAGKSVRWFFVCGLPCETAEDYAELDDIARAVRGFSKGIVQAVFHAFIPQPATPLCVLPLVDEYWEPFNEWRRRFFAGDLGSKRLHILPPARYATRLKHAMESMAATEQELRRGWMTVDNRNWRVKYVATPTQMRVAAEKYVKSLTQTQE